MRFKHYVKIVEKLNDEMELRRVLMLLETDQEITARGYETVRYLILQKIYIQNYMR